ncbi:MAG: DUF2336 domain-containing protein [Alphaproteobacteria bacterium]
MNAPHHHLEKLVNLASEPSTDKRRELLEEVTDMFLEQPAAHSDRETELFGEVMGKVAYQVEMQVRQKLAQRLAQVDESPRDLIVALANDEIDVAGPILRHSGVLHDEDLIAVAKNKGQGHLLAVSQREVVSEAVSEVLVNRGDDEVLVTLAKNAGAEFSRETMSALVEKSEHIEDLHRPLVERHDLPPDLMHNMFWWVSSALREYIATRDDVDESILEDVLDETRADLESQIKANEEDLLRAARRVRKMHRAGQLNEIALVQFLRQKEIPNFIVAFALLCDVDMQTGRRILFDPGHEGLAIACKATGFDRTTFSAIVLLGDENGEKRTHSAKAVNNLMKLFDRMPADAAKRTMRFWRIRKQMTANEAANQETQAAAG